MSDETQRKLWLALREAFLIAVAAIGNALGVQKKCPHCGKALDK